MHQSEVISKKLGGLIAGGAKSLRALTFPIQAEQ
jgi:hypothetical protein